MISFNINQINHDLNFMIKGVSNIQKPIDNTIMFVGRKLSKHINNLENAKECLVLIDSGMNVNDELRSRHCFIESKNPALDYIDIVKPFYEKYIEELKNRKYTFSNKGYTLGEGVELGENVFIEPGCFIDHNVKIGNNTTVRTGAVIRNNVTIGDNCIIKENSVIGSFGFTFAKDNEKNNIRIPSLGGVLVLNDVEIGSFATICSGTAFPTVIDNNVKIDDHVHIGHDVSIGEKTSIAAGSTIAGYVLIGTQVYIGAGATVKNRISIGDKAVVGLAARVYKNVKEMQTVMNESAATMDEIAERQIMLNRIKSGK